MVAIRGRGGSQLDTFARGSPNALGDTGHQVLPKSGVIAEPRTRRRRGRRRLASMEDLREQIGARQNLEVRVGREVVARRGPDGGLCQRLAGIDAGVNAVYRDAAVGRVPGRQSPVAAVDAAIQRRHPSVDVDERNAGGFVADICGDSIDRAELLALEELDDQSEDA